MIGLRILLILVTMVWVAAADHGLRLGQAEVVITPPPGAPMAGYYHNRATEGVHDDLYAKALVMEVGGARAAMVACDVINMPSEIAATARARIEKATGIPADHVMISATHAHTGPVILHSRSRYNLQGEMRRIAEEYAQQLPERIAESVGRAAAALEPAQVQAGAGHDETLTFNRRFFMRNGSVGWNPGKMNPDIVKPAGPIDPEVPVVYFSSPSNKPLTTYVNYTLHLDTVGGLEVSKDYPHTLAQLLARLKGPDMMTMFTIGAAGNLNHINVRSPDRQQGHGEAARIGTVLAGEVLKTYARLHPVTADRIGARSEVVKLPARQYVEEDLVKARRVAPKFGERGAAPFLELVKAFRVLDVHERGSAPLDAEVQVIALGRDVAWVGLPGEIFVEIGLDIKKRSPFERTIIVELANGSVGYVPDRRAYPQGAYEVVSARCAAGSGEMLADAAVRMLEKLAENH